MNYHIIAGYISWIFELIWVLPYLFSIITKKTQPSRVTWFVYSLVGIILFLTYYLSWARETLWQPWVAVLFNITFAVLSIKYWTWWATKLDKSCILGVLITLIAWYITKDPVIGMTFIVIVAIIGSIPTIVKVYTNPETEDSLTWVIWALAWIINLFAIKTWHYEIIFYPIEVAVVVSTICALILRKKTIKIRLD